MSGGSACGHRISATVRQGRLLKVNHLKLQVLQVGGIKAEAIISRQASSAPARIMSRYSPPDNGSAGTDQWLSASALTSR